MQYRLRQVRFQGDDKTRLSSVSVCDLSAVCSMLAVYQQMNCSLADTSTCRRRRGTSRSVQITNLTSPNFISTDRISSEPTGSKGSEFAVAANWIKLIRFERKLVKTGRRVKERSDLTNYRSHLISSELNLIAQDMVHCPVQFNAGEVRWDYINTS